MITAISKSFVGGRNYLNTTNYGLFPSVAIDQMQRAAQALGEGSFDTETRDAALESSRKYFAQLVGVDSPSVAIGSSVSPFVGLVANSLPVRSTVLLVEDDFTSLTLPFVIQRDRLNVVAVPLDKFVDAIDDSIDIAVVSAVQSADGAIVDVDALAQKRNDRNVKIILDATQATGWLPIRANQYDVVVAAAYKWLLCPRGVAFGYFSQEMIEATKPIFAGWFAANNPHTGYYGTDVGLASSARRFDTSPSGINWIGAEPALELLVTCGIESINRHNVFLANHFRRELGIAESNSAIVSIPIHSEAVDRLNASGVKFGLQEGRRAGYARFAFHLYNTVKDATVAASCFR